MKLRVPQTDGPAFRLDGELVFPGDYRIPEDMSQERAQAIVDQGAAQFVAEEQAKSKKAKPDDDILS